MRISLPLYKATVPESRWITLRTIIKNKTMLFPLFASKDIDIMNYERYPHAMSLDESKSQIGTYTKNGLELRNVDVSVPAVPN